MVLTISRYRSAGHPKTSPQKAVNDTPEPAVETTLQYQSGFGNEFASEALPGALPAGQNSPQRLPYGLYAEQLSGTAFTVPRSANRRSWLYRIHPAVMHGRFQNIDAGCLRSTPFDEVPTPNQLRWSPFALPKEACDFLQGLKTIAGNGDSAAHVGCAIHVYCANRSMHDRYFYDADGELLIVPQQGRLRLATELGLLEVGPGEIAVVPRGLRFVSSCPMRRRRRRARLRMRELRRQLSLARSGSDRRQRTGEPTRLFRTGRRLRGSRRPLRTDRQIRRATVEAEMAHSPLDVVAWHGNYVPYKYDLARFNAINTVSFDHPDPSIFTVLTSPSESPGTANPISSSSRRAGWWPNTLSARPIFIAM